MFTRRFLCDFIFIMCFNNTLFTLVICVSEKKRGSILRIELIRCKLSETKQSCNYDEVSSNHELNGQ